MDRLFATQRFDAVVIPPPDPEPLPPPAVPPSRDGGSAYIPSPPAGVVTRGRFAGSVRRPAAPTATSSSDVTECDVEFYQATNFIGGQIRTYTATVSRNCPWLNT